MPGFLQVYGYYDSERESWAIDVIYLPTPLHGSKTNAFEAYGSATHIKSHDHRDSRIFPASWSLWQQIRTKGRTLDSVYTELGLDRDHGGNNECRGIIFRTPATW